MDLNFSIFSTEKSLIFVDETNYSSKPDSPTVSVKFPSLAQTYTSIVYPCSTTVLNTSVLNYCDDIIDMPDGLYTITYSFEPHQYNTITKKIMKLDRAKNSIKSLFKTEDINEELIHKLYKLDTFIEASEYLANIDSDKAVQYFEFIQKEIKKLNC
jgi:hypothetical protein